MSRSNAIARARERELHRKKGRDRERTQVGDSGTISIAEQKQVKLWPHMQTPVRLSRNSYESRLKSATYSDDLNCHSQDRTKFFFNHVLMFRQCFSSFYGCNYLVSFRIDFIFAILLLFFFSYILVIGGAICRLTNLLTFIHTCTYKHIHTNIHTNLIFQLHKSYLEAVAPTP